MPAVFLKDRSLLSISGAEAQSFLQNLITTDIISLEADEARPGALLTPQGKILLLISQGGWFGWGERLVAAPIEVEGERLEAPGTRVEVDFLDVIAVEDGLVARKDSYLDGLAFQAQMEAAA